MKICLPGFILDRGRSGIATYIIELIKNLQLIDFSNQYDILLSDMEKALVTIEKANFTKVLYPTILEKPLLNILWYNTYLPLRAKAQRYDLIHAPCLRRVAIWKTCRQIATVHDLAAFTVTDKYSWPHMLYHHQFLSKAVHRCDHLIAVSHQTKADIVKWMDYPSEKITVIYPGINRNVFRRIDRAEAAKSIKDNFCISVPYIVYVSRLEHPGKNHIRLIQAFEMLKKSAPTSHQLVFVGADWMGAEAIKEYARNSPLSKEIHFLGFVSTPRVVELYSACDLMVFPSLYEGFGFPLLEAMACGAKVACSNSSSLGEIGRGNALMFDPYQPEDIYRCLLQGLKDDDKEGRLDRNVKHLESFDWKRSAEQVLNVYRMVGKI